MVGVRGQKWVWERGSWTYSRETQTVLIVGEDNRGAGENSGRMNRGGGLEEWIGGHVRQ